MGMDFQSVWEYFWEYFALGFFQFVTLLLESEDALRQDSQWTLQFEDLPNSKIILFLFLAANSPPITFYGLGIKYCNNKGWHHCISKIGKGSNRTSLTARTCRHKVWKKPHCKDLQWAPFLRFHTLWRQHSFQEARPHCFREGNNIAEMCTALFLRSRATVQWARSVHCTISKKLDHTPNRSERPQGARRPLGHLSRVSPTREARS